MHEITLLQGLSLAALVFVLGIDFWLEALFLFRPIIVCTLTGAILGDIQTGLITGGLTELAGNDSNLLIVFYVQIMPDDFVMQLHRF